MGPVGSFAGASAIRVAPITTSIATGLGLTISAEIIAGQGGTLNFDTTTGVRHSGTCFKFFLPFQQTETEITRTTRKA